MPRPLSPFEQALFATVRIEAENEEQAWLGTGFYYKFPVGEDEEVILLISNRHVLADAANLGFWCHLKDQNGDPSGQQADIRIPDAATKVIGHPDGTVDLAAIPVGPYVNEILRGGRTVFLKTVDESIMPTPDDWASLDAAQDLFMLGCPMGLFDEHNRFPIFRRGIAASHMAYRYKDRDEFLIDIAAFEGSSGSPVFVNMERKYNRATGMYEQGAHATDLKLVGVLTTGPEYSVEGEVKLGRSGTVKMQLPLHLGIAIKSSQIRPLILAVRSTLSL